MLSDPRAQHNCWRMYWWFSFLSTDVFRFLKAKAMDLWFDMEMLLKAYRTVIPPFSFADKTDT